MDKKKFTSWGVSFASLALVAGMMSYMGMTNKDTTSKSKAAQSQTTTQSSAQVSQSGNSQSSSLNITFPNQSSNNSGDNQASSSQHGSFDTTTGGT